MIYRVVYILRVTYAAGTGFTPSAKFTKEANSVQRCGLRAFTGAYNATSTAALQILSGVLPIDIEVAMSAAIQRSQLQEMAKAEVMDV